MARPAASELTQRELEVMHVFWKRKELTAIEARDLLASQGIDRAYVTVANLVRILVEKGFLKQTNAERPFQYRAARAFQDVSRSLVGELVELQSSDGKPKKWRIDAIHPFDNFELL